MPVAEEVHYLYPESAWALERLQDDPGHLLFKRYGEAVPAEDWNAGGTKQGIYMLGPNGEYLEGLHAASGSAYHLAQRMERALERWAALAEAEGYADEPVPPGDAIAPPEVARAPMALRVSLRDLPRGEGDRSGRRFGDGDKRSRRWMDFTKWAWNQNWLTLDDPSALVPAVEDAEREVPVPAAVVERICRRTLVDNVRGQNPHWPREAVEQATLTMAVVAEADGKVTIEYRGREPRLHGRAVWDRGAERFESFSLVAIGERAGAARFNQRSQDQQPAPMGIVLDLHPAPVAEVAPDELAEPAPR